jgi:hypothetical protein
VTSRRARSSLTVIDAPDPKLGDPMSLLTARLATKIAVGLLAGGVVASGATAAAAYTGTLPVSLQQAAHDTIGAPEPTISESDGTTDESTATPTPTPTPSETPAPTDKPAPTTAPKAGGPDATGPGAHGLCNAYAHGGLSATSTAYAALVKAAGGASTITSYCATIPAPGKSGADHPATSEPTPQATPGAKGKSSEHKPATPNNKKPSGAKGK